MNKTFDALVIGELNVDILFNDIYGLPAVGREVIADRMSFTLGSSSAIFASNLRTLGTSVKFIGRVGNDYFGTYISSCLNNRGVDTSNIITDSESNTGVSMVLNYQEDRAMVTHPGAMTKLVFADIPDEALLESRHLHISSVFLQSGLMPDLLRLFKKAKEFGLTTSLDPQWDPAGKWDIDLAGLSQYVDIFLPNLVEINAITKTTDLDGAIDSIKQYDANIIIKNGKFGASLWDGKELAYQRAFLNSDVVDSIGAGDSFDAGFICKFLRHRPLQECLEFGALMGAVNTTRNGGTDAFSSIELVKDIARNVFGCNVTI
jgi:sugar/nucleoside kinase (ribokinase family)